MTTAAAVGNPGLVSSLNAGVSGASKTEKRDEIGQDAFLKLLITQLKNQDPLDPMKNDQFAVDMAQFSQVEQLISIKETLNKSSQGDMGSLASYLGREVVTGDETINVANGDGGRLKISLPGDAASVKIDILDADGNVKETVDAGALKKGENTVKLDKLITSEGEFSFKVTALSSSGGELTNKAEVAGLVSGFIPGADPKLLVGNKQISPADIVRVGVA